MGDQENEPIGLFEKIGVVAAGAGLVTFVYGGAALLGFQLFLNGSTSRLGSGASNGVMAGAALLGLSFAPVTVWAAIKLARAMAKRSAGANRAVATLGYIAAVAIPGCVVALTR